MVNSIALEVSKHEIIASIVKITISVGIALFGVFTDRVNP